ncbi:MAG: penicillin-binding protein 2 [Rhodospirillaceae bacterium]|nr:penicillin-binding protein 2 [Rhodospirillaceae bacterium]
MIVWNQGSRKIDFAYPGEDIQSSPKARVTLVGETQRAVEIGRARVMVTAGIFTFAFLSISVRLVDLMVLNGALDTGTRYTANTSQTTDIFRADIVDRNGRTVATTLPTVNLYAEATKIIDADLAANALITALPGLNFEVIKRRLESNQKFVYLRRHLTPTQQLRVNTLGIPGLHFQESERRIYPYGSLFSHVVGATDPDNRGKTGLELSFDGTLSRKLSPLELTLDSGVQNAVRDTLAVAMGRFGAVGAAGIVMDATTGEVVSLVSLPDFDPRDNGRADGDAQFNRATLGVYEMGSTFKIFTAAMALEMGVRMDSVYDARAPITVSGHTINDYHAEKRWLTFPEVLIHSSNIGAAQLALNAGMSAQRSFLDKLGLLSPVDIELPEVGRPIYPKIWRDIHTTTISYGHGIAVTPVHVASAVSAMVNGGTLNRPTLIKRSRIPDEDSRRVISEATSKQLRSMMRLVVTEGSGKKAEVSGYVVGGKTGTAEKVARAGGYNKNSRRTSFVAAFPMHAPRYVVFVLLDEPQGTKETFNYTGAGWNAAPTVGRIIAEIAPMLGVYPTKEQPMAPEIGNLVEASARISEMALAPALAGFGGDRAVE